MNQHFTKKNIIITITITVLAVFCFGIFIPRLPGGQAKSVTYTLEKGTGFRQIGIDLQKQGVILNHGFFSAYALGTLRYNKLQAGTYEVSPSMSVAKIIKKMATGDVVKNTVTIIEGWDLRDISKLYGGAKIDKTLEGYLFPDTYELSVDGGLDELIEKAKANFDKKMTAELKAEITKQKKTVKQIIIMASMIEKEVITTEDKKMVSGILWKRIAEGMPLQVDATVNYVTGKNDAGATIKDTTIDSPYNTYKYYGLPAGPISNPGMDSILSAIYPTKSDYWYYLSTEDKTTIFSKTLEEHNTAVQKYLK